MFIYEIEFFSFQSTAKRHGYFYSLHSLIRPLGLTDVISNEGKPRKSIFPPNDCEADILHKISLKKC